MMNILLPVLIAGLICALAIVLLQKVAPLLGLVDDPEGRKQHRNSTPVTGGLAIGLGLFSLALSEPELFAEHWVVFSCACALLLLGVLDDLFEVHSAARMLLQIGVGCALHFEANLPFRSVGDIWFIGDLGLGPYSLTFTCIAVVGGINAINMMDGLDGLCGWMVNAAFFWLAVLGYLAGDEQLFSLSLTMLCIVSAFLLFNFRFPWNKEARVFLGDSGAYVLGFMVVVLFLMASQGVYVGEVQALTPVTALWLLFIPLVDIAGVIWRRSRKSRWPVDDDREHLHYMLVDRGRGVARVVNLLTIAAFAIGGFGVALLLFNVPESWSYVMFMAACCCYFVFTNRMLREPVAPDEGDTSPIQQVARSVARDS